MSDSGQRSESAREEFFEKYGAQCSCIVGFVVCENCRTYYGLAGRLRLLLGLWLGWAERRPLPTSGRE